MGILCWKLRDGGSCQAHIPTVPESGPQSGIPTFLLRFPLPLGVELVQRSQGIPEAKGCCLSTVGSDCQLYPGAGTGQGPLEEERIRNPCQTLLGEGWSRWTGTCSADLRAHHPGLCKGTKPCGDRCDTPSLEEWTFYLLNIQECCCGQ